MTDEMDIDLPDIAPPHKVLHHEVKDQFSYDVAFNLAFVGVGQGGGRVAETFHRLGYGRVGVINTAYNDLKDIDDAIPKLDLGTGGAGKDPEYGANSVNRRDAEIWEHLTRSVGDKPDYLLVCAGLGGGTGTGATPKVIEVARRYMQDHGRDPNRVGAILTLPHDHEGQAVCRNAVHGFEKIHSMGVTPLLVIDNKRINEVYSSVGISEIYKVCNEQVAKLLHLFNRLAAQRSKLITFDRADFATLLDSGIAVFGASPVAKYASSADISEAIRTQLGATVLAEVDYSRGKKAGCIFVGGQSILEQVPMDFFGGGFDMLNRLLAEGSVVHRGVYEGNSADLRCYTMLAELPPPVQRLQQLASKAHLKVTGGLADFLSL